MSVTRRCQCDRCGAEVTADRTDLRIRCGPLRGHGLDRLDLCRACATALEEWLKSRPPAEGERSCADT